MKHELNQLAVNLDKAAANGAPIAQLAAVHNIDLEQAYQIQKYSVGKRLERGEVLTGYKLGFTSRAKMDQMGVHEVIWGRLTDAMHITSAGVMDLRRFIHPRAEPEIVFRVSKDIDEVLTEKNVFEYFDAVAAAIEVIDSRYEHFKFTLEDVVADNCSSSAYVIGDWKKPETAVNDLSISLVINDVEVQKGNSNAILGNPIDSLIEMSKMAVKYGETIAKGKILLAGAATSAEFLKSGDKVQAIFDTLGSVRLNVS